VPPPGAREAADPSPTNPSQAMNHHNTPHSATMKTAFLFEKGAVLNRSEIAEVENLNALIGWWEPLPGNKVRIKHTVEVEVVFKSFVG
jgi:hypothetical protein